jgi:2-oxoglutarate dehydrogenase E2 component (dihydrolipoamide succinyltransferase)
VLLRREIMANIAELKVPEMGESITEGTVASWLKAVGDPVEADEAIAEIETDKVTQEIFAPAAGVLKSIAKDVGENVSIHEVIGTIEEGAAATKTDAAPVSSAPVEESKAATENMGPAARKMVAENNLSPADISGTGRHGQITKQDVVKHLDNPSSPPAPPAAAAPAPPKRSATTGEREKVVPMTRLRQAIARRLVEAQQTAAILTTFNEVDMYNVMQLRSQYKELFLKKYDVKLGFMSFFTKAVIAALKEVPAINAEIRDDALVYKSYYDIGVAVGGPKGLVVPVLRDADLLSFAEVEGEINRLALRVKEGSITLSEMQGGTFTVTNGGIYGSMMSTPILNPPQSGILGMHNIVERAMVVNGEIKSRPMMYIALSYDHRIVDGKEAVTFLVKVKEAIEDPQRLLLEV